jgi:hypothetical protein
MLALNRPKWRITGLEIQKEDVTISRANALGCGLVIEFLEADIREWIALSNTTDCLQSPLATRWIPAGNHQLLPRAIGRQESIATQAIVTPLIEGNLARGERDWLIYPRDKDAISAGRLPSLHLTVRDCSSRDNR